MNKTITVETTVRGDLETIWGLWASPEHIQKWLHASNDWECPMATNDLRVGGRFSYLMAAKDKSTSFDFAGTYTAVEKNKLIAYTMDDGRTATVLFDQGGDGVRIVETFEMENDNPEEMQRSGWQAILDNFKLYAEQHGPAEVK